MLELAMKRALVRLVWLALHLCKGFPEGGAVIGASAWLPLGMVRSRHAVLARVLC